MRKYLHIFKRPGWGFGIAVGNDPDYQCGVILLFWRWEILLGRVKNV